MSGGILSGLLGGVIGGDAGQSQMGGGILGGLNQRLTDNSGMLLGLGSGLLSGEGWGQGMQGAMQGMQLDQRTRLLRQKEAEEAQKKQALAQAATQLGIDPVLAQASPELIGAVAAKKYAPKELSFEERQFNALNPEQQAQYRQQKFLNGGGELSLNPIYGKDAQGNTVLMQVGKNGQAVQTKLPEGVQVSSGVDKVDLGTRWGLVDKRSGQLVGYEQKDLAGAEAQKVIGKAQGEGQIAAPDALAGAQQALDTISKIRTHPGRANATGMLGWSPGMPGSPARDFVALVDQAKGKAFLEAFEGLKGGGQITEVEGTKAEQAIARLDRAQSKEGFDQALADLENVIKVGMARARRKGGMPEASPQPEAAKRRRYNPQTGDFE